MKENSIGDRIEEKYTRYINCETDILELTIEEAIFILEKDASVHYVEDLLQEAYKVILSDYKRVLKENELLRKDIEGWKKYCEEIEEEQTKMSNKNCELEFKVEELQKENEELKKIDKIVKNITEEDIEKAIKEYDECEDEFATKLSLKQFDINVVYSDYLEKLNEYKENSIPIQKVKDKIEKLNKKEKEELKGLKGQDRYFVKQIYQNKRIILQELIEERGKKDHE